MAGYNPSILLAFKIARYFAMSIEDILFMKRNEKEALNKTHNQSYFLCSGCAGPMAPAFAEAAASGGYWPGASVRHGIRCGQCKPRACKWENDGAYQEGRRWTRAHIAIKKRPAISPACLLQRCWEFQFLCVWAIQFRHRSRRHHSRAAF